MKRNKYLQITHGNKWKHFQINESSKWETKVSWEDTLPQKKKGENMLVYRKESRDDVGDWREWIMYKEQSSSLPECVT